MALIPFRSPLPEFAGPRFVTSFAVDAQTLSFIEKLQTSFGVNTPAEAVQRALALAKLITENASEKNSITLQVGDSPLVITLNENI